MKDFSVKFFFDEHLTYLKVCHVKFEIYICSEEQDKGYTLLAQYDI